ncbi:DUF1003 domain-containing protein [Luteimonas sp. 100069]|uniref:DUF1003 domain-containing protein n=1 Tax=Luteimonas sp. 100069 TaxID=2006109 RepID=UPI000F4F1293|nr:DUF1003 domain-containing protein [Luteimonas sp. 100069]RPD85192.1 DUF1003 domain-containing protein [Luteimonas sp. 100069]
MQPKPSFDYLARARAWLGGRRPELDRATREIVQRAIDRGVTSTDPGELLDNVTVGQALADRVAAFGGSWTFIALFVGALVAWVALNTAALGSHAIDPFPYIFLNLMLSIIAALQAPVIMMSQNRQASKDREMAGYDYAVNLKAELEIMALHEKMDAMRSDQIMLLLTQQQTQLDLLTRLVERASEAAGDAGAGVSDAPPQSSVP